MGLFVYNDNVVNYPPLPTYLTYGRKVVCNE